MQHDILIGFGGNLNSAIGKPRQTMKRALSLLGAEGVAVTCVSAIYNSIPVPASAQPDFINIVVRAKTCLSPPEVLTLFQKIEVGCGRKPAERWSARTLDIDLLSFDTKILPSLSQWIEVTSDTDVTATLAEPVVPHPRLHKRAFVLVPMMDIAPEWVHPVLKKTVAELLNEDEVLEERPGVVKISQTL